MDWNGILTLINGVDTLLGAVILVVAVRYGLRALRSRWSSRSESSELTRIAAEHDRGMHQRYMGWQENCPRCNPQPKSQPQSERRSEAGAGKNGG